MRNLAAGGAAADDIIAATGTAGRWSRTLDLADRASVAAFAAEWDGPLHILVNNAGVMACRRRAREGWELQFATNHLGHFAFTTGLHARSRPRRSRVVRSALRAHVRSAVVFDDIHFRAR